MPVQQIVYHMLRVFAKTEHVTGSTDKSGPERLSNYHIKTLMLWACELKPIYWWTDDLGLVTICVELLHILAAWVVDVQTPHYFVKNCSLIDNSFDTEMISSQLMSLDRTSLSAWFLSKYVRKCSRLCSNNVSLLFDDASTSVERQTAVSVIISRRLDNVLYDLWVVFLVDELNISCHLPRFLISVRSYANAVARIDARRTRPISVYFTAVTFLHIAQKISIYNFDDELMDVLATAIGQHVGTRRHSKQTSSMFVLREATKLMSVVANKSLSTLELIKIELSKAYLYRALRCKDANSDSIYCLVNVYLAVLYYSAGNYRTVIDHCTVAMVSRDYAQCSSHVVLGKLLPKIDDDIDSVLGLSVFYQYLRTVALSEQQGPPVGVFTTELFAYYLHIKCLSAKNRGRFVQMLSADDIIRYRKYVTDKQQLVICDVLVLKLELKFQYKPEQHKCQQAVQAVQDTSCLVELLQRSAVDHLTDYRQCEARDFASLVTIIPTDFQALYAYHRGDYRYCLQLCTRNVHTLFPGDVHVRDVPIFPPLIHLLDADIVSLFSLTRIVDPKCEYRALSFSCVSQLTLLLYMMIQCQLKLRRSVTSLATSVYVKTARSKLPIEQALDHLTLKLIERRLIQYLQ